MINSIIQTQKRVIQTPERGIQTLKQAIQKSERVIHDQKSLPCAETSLPVDDIDFRGLILNLCQTGVVGYVNMKRNNSFLQSNFKR